MVLLLDVLSILHYMCEEALSIFLDRTFFFLGFAIYLNLQIKLNYCNLIKIFERKPKFIFRMGSVVCACNPSTKKTETGGLTCV